MPRKETRRKKEDEARQLLLNLSVTADEVEAYRLLEERNLVGLEPYLFFLDQSEQREAEQELKEANARPSGKRKVRSVVEFEKGTADRSIKVEVDAEHGLPRELAYRVFQAALYKVTRNPLDPSGEGAKQPEATVYFSKRELSELAGRPWGGKNDEELFSAIYQLARMRITTNWFDRETGDDIEVTFTPLVSAFFRRRPSIIEHGPSEAVAASEEVHVCAFRLHPVIIKGYADAYIRVFNMNRLLPMRPMASILYKSMFLEFCAVLDKHHVGRGRLRIERLYSTTVCQKWLGGHAPRRYKSRIERHIGGALDELCTLWILRQWQLVEAKRGVGYKLVLFAGDAMHDDYEDFYRSSPILFGGKMPEIAAAPDTIMELLVYYHEQKCGRSLREFTRKEISLAGDLLRQYSFDECRDLIDYTFEQISPDYTPQVLGFLSTYIPRWRSVRTERLKSKDKAQRIEACPYCNAAGQIVYTDENERITRMFGCPHDEARIRAFIEGQGWSLPHFLK